MDPFFIPRDDVAAERMIAEGESRVPLGPRGTDRRELHTPEARIQAQREGDLRRAESLTSFGGDVAAGLFSDHFMNPPSSGVPRPAWIALFKGSYWSDVSKEEDPDRYLSSSEVGSRDELEAQIGRGNEELARTSTSRLLKRRGITRRILKLESELEALQAELRASAERRHRESHEIRVAEWESTYRGTEWLAECERLRAEVEIAGVSIVRFREWRGRGYPVLDDHGASLSAYMLFKCSWCRNREELVLGKIENNGPTKATNDLFICFPCTRWTQWSLCPQDSIRRLDQSHFFERLNVRVEELWKSCKSGEISESEVHTAIDEFVADPLLF